MNLSFIKLQYLFFFCILSFTTTMYAQQQSSKNNVFKEKKVSSKLFKGLDQYNHIIIGLFGGATIGVVPPNDLKNRDFRNSQPSLAGGISVRAMLSHAFGFQLEAIRGSVKGDNLNTPPGQENPTSFSSYETKLNYDIGVYLYWNILNFNITNTDPTLKVFAKLGGGFISYQPTVVSIQNAQEIQRPQSTTRYVGAGLGFKFRINTRFDFFVDYSLRFTGIDEFDGNTTASPNNPGDNYSILSAGVTMAIPSRTKPNLDWINAAELIYDQLIDSTRIVNKEIKSIKKEFKEIKKDVGDLQVDVGELKRDADKDGVQDLFDRCPNTPINIKVDGSGCPLDVDGDGIFDSVDICPTVRGVRANEGCPEGDLAPFLLTEELEVIQELFINLLFEFNKFRILDSSFPSLDKMAELLIKRGDLSIKLYGYTDAIGSEKYNLRLSQQRAKAVRNYLVKKGVDDSIITFEGLGEAKPIADNELEAGRALNRRVEFEVLKK